MAQAANPAGAGAGDAPQSALQNPKVQIAVVAVAAVVLIGVIWFVFMGGGGGGGAAPANPATGTDTAGSYAAGGSGPGVPGVPAGGATPPAAPGAPPAAPGGTGAMPGATPGAAPEAGKGKKAVTGTNNPFRQNTEITAVLDTIPEPPEIRVPATMAPELEIYKELYKPKPTTQVSQDENDGPPIPAMRVAGVVFGQAAGPSATIQIGEAYMQVTPGKMVPNDNPVFRVERIEQEKVILSRRWEIGGRKGVQRIEVTLAGSAARPAGGGFAPPGGAGGNVPGGNRPGLN